MEEPTLIEVKGESRPTLAMRDCDDCLEFQSALKLTGLFGSWLPGFSSTAMLREDCEFLVVEG